MLQNTVDLHSPFCATILQQMLQIPCCTALGTDPFPIWTHRAARYACPGIRPSPPTMAPKSLGLYRIHLWLTEGWLFNFNNFYSSQNKAFRRTMNMLELSFGILTVQTTRFLQDFGLQVRSVWSSGLRVQAFTGCRFIGLRVFQPRNVKCMSFAIIVNTTPSTLNLSPT